MPARDRKPRFGVRRAMSRAGGVLLAATAVIGGCSYSHAPPGFLPTPPEASTSTRGGWIHLSLYGPPPSPRRDKEYLAGDFLGGKAPTRSGLAGEFLAQEGDSLYLLTDQGFQALSVTAVARATLWGYDARAGDLGIWVLAGSLSTVSHGYGIVFSLPVWLIGGSAIAAGQSHAPRLIWPDRTWSELRPYARYPAGLPPGLNRTVLHLP